MHIRKLSLQVLLLAVVFSFSGYKALSQVKLTEEDWILPTYHVATPDKNPMFFRGESYQGASKVIYPYALNDVISHERSEHAWKALILENEYIKLCVTPEIGGKLYYATDKTNNYNFIYKNNIVKPSNIGMTGAWVSGGIEWCVLHHHRASTFLPVDYEMVENADGSKTIYIGETEPRHRMRWTIGITAFPGKSYFEAEIKIHNASPLTHTFLYWANVAAHTNENYQVIFPPSVTVATYHAKNSFTHWPFSTGMYAGHNFTEGVDVSWWKNVVNSASFFAHDLKEDFMGGYDHGRQTGTVHIGDHNIVKGAKLWEWGSGPRGQATEARLTENDGPYVEIMTGGFSDNQPDYSWIRPYEVKILKQYWYPVKDIGGFKNANLHGAVNLEAREKNTVFLGYNSTSAVGKARILLKWNDKVIFEKETDISPEKAFRQTIKIPGPYDMTDLATEMINAETGEVLVSYKPKAPEKADRLPDPVRRPDPPKEIPTVEELYLTGSRIEQFYNPTMSAMDYYREVLERDPGDIRTNTAVGNIHLKNGEYELARNYFLKAIKRLTKDYTRPSDCEPFHLHGLALKTLGLYIEAEDTLYHATWDYAYHSAAYLELARISCIRGDFAKALAQVDESLSTNSRNNSAIGLKASILRHHGDLKGAEATLTALLSSDPLDFRATNEAYLIALGSGNREDAERLLSTLNRVMRNFDQNYLELAAGYLNDGLYDEAGDVLKRYPGKNPMIDYYLGYIADIKGNKKEAAIYFKAASEQPVDYVFPYRMESVKVFETSLKYFPYDSKPWYYLGNLLYDRQPQKALECWEKAVEFEPSIAIAWRNLGWGYYRHEGDGHKAITAYEKAISLNRNEPAYYNELDALYEMSNSPVEKRLALFEGSNEVVGQRDDSFVRQITVLTLAGRPDKAVEYLTGRDFSYREGSSRVREVIIDAQLMLGSRYFAEKDYKKALEHFLLAQVPDEEAGGARSANRDVQVNYHIGLAYEALGNRSRARNYFSLSAEQNVRGLSYIRYYQALSYLKLGKKKEATDIFNSLITEGDRQINQRAATEVDFFAKFGEQEAENARLSNAYLIRGLGHKGLGNTAEAKASLQKAVELSTGNLYANIELNN